MAERKRQALELLARWGEQNTNRALAILATGGDTAEAEKLLAVQSDYIRRRFDCSDFYLVYYPYILRTFGKRGSGISVEAKVKSGPVTMLGVTQTVDGRLKLIISEGESTKGTIMQIGNTQTPVKFSVDPDTYFERWFEEAPTHHCAMSIGHNAALMKKVAELMNLEYVIL